MVEPVEVGAVFRARLVGAVMADGAARRSARRAVADHMARDAADDGTLEAALGLGLSDSGDGGEGEDGSNGQSAHGVSPG